MSFNSSFILISCKNLYFFLLIQLLQRIQMSGSKIIHCERPRFGKKLFSDKIKFCRKTKRIFMFCSAESLSVLREGKKVGSQEMFSSCCVSAQLLHWEDAGLCTKAKIKYIIILLSHVLLWETCEASVAECQGNDRTCTILPSHATQWIPNNDSPNSCNVPECLLSFFFQFVTRNETLKIVSVLYVNKNSKRLCKCLPVK